MRPKSTHGGADRNAGRRSADGAAVKRHMVTLDTSTVERLKAKDIGDGQLSIGIRRAAKIVDGLKTCGPNPLHEHHKGE